MSAASPSELLDRARRFLRDDLWATEHRDRGFVGRLLRLLQLGMLLVEGFVSHELLLRASSLTYIAALTLVPALIVVFSLVRALGLGDQAVLFAVDQLEVVSEKGASTLTGLVQGSSLGALGTVGAITTFVSTVLALRHLEHTLNTIWGVHRGRSWLRRFADYLLVIVVVPLVLSAAFSLETTLQAEPLVALLMEIPGFEFLYRTGLRQLPLLLLLAGFTFTYWFVPNTDVHVRSAALGGLVAAALFVALQRYFLSGVAGAARYDALFGSFAAIPLVLLWLYLASAVVLLGAEVSYAHQNLARYRREVHGGPPSAAEREVLGLRIALEVSRRFRDRLPPAGSVELAEALDAGVSSVRGVCEAFQEAGILVATAEEERSVRFTLGRPAPEIEISELLAALRGEPGVDGALEDPVGRTVADLVGALGDAEGRVSRERSLEDLLQQVPRPVAAGEAGAP